MIEERRKVLELLSSGRISSEEAERLIEAVQDQDKATGSETNGAFTIPKRRARYLRVVVDSPTEKVDVRIPFFLLRAGMKLANLLPNSSRGRITSAFQEKGIDIDLTKGSDLESLIEGLQDLQIETESGIAGKTERVRVFCE